MASKLNLKQMFQFVRLMTIEPYVFLIIFAYLLIKLPTDQLIQDKICIQVYGQSWEYCKNLPQMAAEDDASGDKSSILSDATHFNMYITFMTLGPSMVACLFIGPFMDKYPPSKKFLLLISAVMFTMEALLHVANCYFFDWGKIFPTILSYPMVTMAAVWCYVTTVTPAHIRAIRMITMELAFFLATPISTFLGGLWLNKDPYLVGRELRNYSTVYFIGIGCIVISFFLALFLINENKEIRLYKKYFPEPIPEIKPDENLDKNNNNNYNTTDIEDVKPSQLENGASKPTNSNETILQMLFNLENVRKMFRTVAKPRPYKIRMQLIISMLSVVLYIFCYLGPMTVLYQYVQHVFNWDSKQYSQYQSLSLTINLVTSLIGSPILLKVVGITDITLTMVTIAILFVQMLLRSVSTSLLAFNIAMVFCTLNLIGTIGLRNYISKIVHPSEIGAVFTIISLMEQVSLLINSAAISNIFTSTMDTYPTTVFMVLGFLVLVDMVMVCTISLYSDKTLKALEQNPIQLTD